MARNVGRLLAAGRRIHRHRLELALRQYCLGLVTAGTVMGELRMLREIDQMAEQLEPSHCADCPRVRTCSGEWLNECGALDVGE